VDQGETRNVKTGRVRQGCYLSPIMLKLYSIYLIKDALGGFEDFKIGGQIAVSYCEICR